MVVNVNRARIKPAVKNGPLSCRQIKENTENVTISFRSRARAASRLAGLLASRLSALFLPRLRSSWIMVFFTYILSISLQEPPLEFSNPLRLFGSGGRPSMQAIPPSVPFVDLPFIVLCVTKRGELVSIKSCFFQFKDATNTVIAQQSPTLNKPSNSRAFLTPGQPTTPRSVIPNEAAGIPV